MYLYDKTMVVTTNHVCQTIIELLRHHNGTKLGKKKNQNRFFRISEEQSAELKQTTTAKRLLFARDTS